jgi:mannosyltransferase OCH1-like enzyme
MIIEEINQSFLLEQFLIPIAVPKNIYQICFSTSSFLRTKNSVKQKNPKWKYRSWNLMQANQFVKNSKKLIPWIKLWSTIKNKKAKEIVFQYMLLYTLGGIVVTKEAEVLQSFDSLLMNHRIVGLCYQYQTNKIMRLTGLNQSSREVFLGFMISAPNQPLFEKFLNFLLYTYNPNLLITNSVGGNAFHKFLCIERLDNEELLPEIWIDTSKILKTNDMPKKYKDQKQIIALYNPLRTATQLQLEVPESVMPPTEMNFVQEFLHKWHICILIVLVMIIFLIFLFMVRRKRN